MSLQLSLKTHDQRVSRDGRVLQTRVNPYLRICVADLPPVFLQEGHFFAEEVGLLDIDDLPDWVIPELAKCTPESLDECKCPKSVLENVQKARMAYTAQQKAAAEDRRKKLYGNR